MVELDKFLGLMSGTSVDAIDAVIAQTKPFQILHSQSFVFPEAWRAFALALGQGQAQVDLDQLGQFDIALGEAFASSALALIARAGLSPHDIVAIGSHGQTVRHRPNLPHPFTLQLGCPHVIAERTGICTIADFRRRDVAAGGQGAPLVPAFHHAIFGTFAERVAVLNLGGIANVTLIQGDTVVGFDTGPANALLDSHMLELNGAKSIDTNGDIAAQGRADTTCLQQLLADSYFAQPPPKSSGREHFNLAWVRELAPRWQNLSAHDRQATLAELTAQTVATTLRQFAAPINIVCGGGVQNADLLRRIATQLNRGQQLQSSAAYGIDPDYVEAGAFAWLAQQTLIHRGGNLPAVTGARAARVLGAICAANESIQA